MSEELMNSISLKSVLEAEEDGPSPAIGVAIGMVSGRRARVRKTNYFFQAGEIRTQCAFSGVHSTPDCGDL